MARQEAGTSSRYSRISLDVSNLSLLLTVFRLVLTSTAGGAHCIPLLGSLRPYEPKPRHRETRPVPSTASDHQLRLFARPGVLAAVPRSPWFPQCQRGLYVET